MSGDLPSKYRAEIKQIIAETADKVPRSDAIIGHIQKLSEFIVGIATEYDPGINTEFRAKVDAIMKFMIDNTLNYPTAKDFRKIVASSKQQFEMKVKYVFNRSLKSLCDELKFKNAMYEICFTQKPISDISYDHGYSELSSFSRSIKARFGQSPRNIRKTTEAGFLDLFTQ